MAESYYVTLGASKPILYQLTASTRRGEHVTAIRRAPNVTLTAQITGSKPDDTEITSIGTQGFEIQRKMESFAGIRMMILF